jgi:transcriptional regulator with XRE-family HTH domain
MSGSVRTVLAANLRVLRELRGLNQLELADRVGVSRRTIARLEAAEIADPGIDQVRAIAAALEVSLAVLIEERLALVRIPIPVAQRDSVDPDALDRMIRALSVR